MSLQPTLSTRRRSCVAQSGGSRSPACGGRPRRSAWSWTLAALRAADALLQRRQVAVGVDPEEVHVGAAHEVEVLLEEGGVPLVALDQARRHEDHVALLRDPADLVKDGRPDPAAKVVVRVATVWDQSHRRVDEQVVVQEAGLVGGQERFGLLENGVFSRAGEAVQDSDHAPGVVVGMACFQKRGGWAKSGWDSRRCPRRMSRNPAMALPLHLGVNPICNQYCLVQCGFKSNAVITPGFGATLSTPGR